MDGRVLPRPQRQTRFGFRRGAAPWRAGEEEGWVFRWTTGIGKREKGAAGRCSNHPAVERRGAGAAAPRQSFSIASRTEIVGGGGAGGGHEGRKESGGFRVQDSSLVGD